MYCNSIILKVIVLFELRYLLVVKLSLVEYIREMYFKLVIN